MPLTYHLIDHSPWEPQQAWIRVLDQVVGFCTKIDQYDDDPVYYRITLTNGSCKEFKDRVAARAWLREQLGE